MTSPARAPTTARRRWANVFFLAAAAGLCSFTAALVYRLREGGAAPHLVRLARVGGLDVGLVDVQLPAGAAIPAISRKAVLIDLLKSFVPLMVAVIGLLSALIAKK